MCNMSCWVSAEKEPLLLAYNICWFGVPRIPNYSHSEKNFSWSLPDNLFYIGDWHLSYSFRSCPMSLRVCIVCLVIQQFRNTISSGSDEVWRCVSALFVVVWIFWVPPETSSLICHARNMDQTRKQNATNLNRSEINSSHYPQKLDLDLESGTAKAKVKNFLESIFQVML